MTSQNVRLQNLESEIAALKAQLLSQQEKAQVFSALGTFVKYGCKVTEGSASPLDMTVRLQGQASGDSSYLNPDVAASPTRFFQYANIGGTKGGAFYSNDTTATVETAPAAGTARYDIAYIFAGRDGAGFQIAEGTPSAAVLTDFGANGLQTQEYATASPNYDPTLPVGAVPVARIYVAPEVTAITDSAIADLRSFQAPTALQTAISNAEEWANKAEDSLVSAGAGGDQVDDYSALHHAEKAKEYGEAWASTAEDTLVPTAAGGDGANDYSAKHHANKASASATAADGSATSAANSAAAAAEIVNIDDVAIYANPRALSQAIHMTSASSGSNGIQVADDDNIDFGTEDFTVALLVSVPDTTPSAQISLANKVLASTGWYLDLRTTGVIRMGLNGTTYDSTESIEIGGDQVFMVNMSVVRESSGAAGSITPYVNGVPLGSSLPITAGAPATVSISQPLYVAGNSTARTEATIFAARFFNRALSAAEVLDLALNGIADADKWGSQTDIATFDFGAGVAGFSSGSGGSQETITANQDSIGGEDDWLLVDVLADANIRISWSADPIAKFKRAKIKFKVFLPSSNAGTGAVFLSGWDAFSTDVAAYFVHKSSVSSGTNNALSVATSITQENTVIEVEAEIESRQANNAGQLSFWVLNATTGDKLYIKISELKYLGATLALEPEGIDSSLQWEDSSDNNLHAMMPAAGATQTRRVKEFTIRSTHTWAGTHEAQYIGGVNQAILPDSAWIESIVGDVTGGTIEDIIIGDGSDTDRFVAITTGLATGVQSFTIANNTHDGTNKKMVIDPDAAFTGTINLTVRGYNYED